MEGEQTGTSISFTFAIRIKANPFAIIDHVWGAIDITIKPETNFQDWRNLCTISAANTTIMSIPREDDKMRLYLDLGLEDGLVDTSTGRVTAQNVDAKRLLEARITSNVSHVRPG